MGRLYEVSDNGIYEKASPLKATIFVQILAHISSGGQSRDGLYRVYQTIRLRLERKCARIVGDGLFKSKCWTAELTVFYHLDTTVTILF